MKTRILAILLFFIGFAVSNAQMRIQQDGNFVVFVYDDANDEGLWDAAGNPIYIYAYVLAEDASNNVASDITGPFPGLVMADLGDDLYKLTIDLADFYPDGTTIEEIYYVINDNMGTQVPETGGFSGVEASFVPVTINTLSTEEFDQLDREFSIISGQLHGNFNENVSVNVFDLNGRLIRNYSAISIDPNTGFDLNLNKGTMYIVSVSSERGTQIIKTIH